MLASQTRLTIYSNGIACESFSGNTASASMELTASSQSADFPLPLLTAAWSDPDFSFLYIGQETLNGSAVYHVQLFDTYASNLGLQPLSQFTTKDLWVDTITGLPQKLAYQRRDGGGEVPRIALAVSYSDWRNVNGILYPYQIQKSWNGTPWATITIQNVAFQTGLPDAEFPVSSQPTAQRATTMQPGVML
jgi:outer membrane lipoprotein-sorting protein